LEVDAVLRDKTVLTKKIAELEQDLSSIRDAAGTLCGHFLSGKPDAVPSAAQLEAVQGRVEELIADGV
jgi:hypothetical protein